MNVPDILLKSSRVVVQTHTHTHTHLDRGQVLGDRALSSGGSGQCHHSQWHTLSRAGVHHSAGRCSTIYCLTLVSHYTPPPTLHCTLVTHRLCTSSAVWIASHGAYHSLINGESVSYVARDSTIHATHTQTDTHTVTLTSSQRPRSHLDA